MTDRPKPRSRIRRRPTGGFCRRIGATVAAAAAAAAAATGSGSLWCLTMTASAGLPTVVMAQQTPQPGITNNLRRRLGGVADDVSPSHAEPPQRQRRQRAVAGDDGRSFLAAAADEFDRPGGETLPDTTGGSSSSGSSSSSTFHDYNYDMMGPPASTTGGGGDSGGRDIDSNVPAAVMTSFALRGGAAGGAAKAESDEETSAIRPVISAEPKTNGTRTAGATTAPFATTAATGTGGNTTDTVATDTDTDTDTDTATSTEADANGGIRLESPVGAPIDPSDDVGRPSSRGGVAIAAAAERRANANGDIIGIRSESESEIENESGTNIRPPAVSASAMSGLGGLLGKYEEHVASGADLEAARAEAEAAAEAAAAAAAAAAEDEEEEEEEPLLVPVLRHYASDPAFQSPPPPPPPLDVASDETSSALEGAPVDDVHDGTPISEVLTDLEVEEVDSEQSKVSNDDEEETPLAEFFQGLKDGNGNVDERDSTGVAPDGAFPVDTAFATTSTANTADASIIQEARESADTAATAVVVRASLNEHQIPLMTAEETVRRQLDRERARRLFEINRQKTHEITVRTDCSHYNCREVSSPKNDPEAWTTVGPRGGRYKTIEHALEAGEKQIYVQEGTYEIRQTIILGQNHVGVHIRGASRERTILKFVGMESFVVVFNTRDVTISNLSLDARSANHDALKDMAIYGQSSAPDDGTKHQPQWQVVGVVNSSGVSIVDTVIHSPKTMVPIFFTGPFFASSRIYSTFFGGSKSRYRPGETETVQAYKAGFLDEYNAVRNNHIYSNSEGDALVFTLQRNGAVDGNKVSSGGISFYMNSDSTCNQNTILRSPIHGVYVTVPSDRVEIANNKIVHSHKSAIKVGRMTDHVQLGLPTVETTERPQYRATGVALVGNQLFDIKSIGIEIELTHGCVVKHNSISRTDYSGIFLQHSDTPLIMNNRLEDFGLLADRHEHNAGIYGAAAVAGAVISNNIIIDFMSHGARYGMKIAELPENINAIISQNTISGQYTSGESISAPPSAIEKDNTYII